MQRTPSADELTVLLRKANSGDGSALEDLLIRLHPVITRFLRRRLGYDPAAESLIEDAAIETLAHIAAAAQSCRAETDAQLVAWTLATARNAANDELRRGYLRHAAEAVAVENVAAQDGGDADAERSEAERVLMRVQQEVYDALPEDLQVLLWLHLVEGATWAEVANELGTTPAGAKRRYQRGQDRLRREMSARIHTLPDRERQLVLGRLAEMGLGQI